MFDDDEEEFADGSLIEDIERFEAHLQGNTLPFMDSDRIENIIDHYLVQGQYLSAAFNFALVAVNYLLRPKTK